MKRYFLSAVLATAPLAAAAQPVTGPYVSLGAGVNFLQNEQARPVNGFGPAPRVYHFDVGPAVQGSVGYGFGNGLRVEIEGDFASNHISSVSFGGRSAGYRAGGTEHQFGGFVNGLYDIDVGLPVFPYVGVGVGYQAVELRGVNSSPVGFRIPSGGDETAGNFAYQGIAGVSYPIPAVAPGLSLTAEYRFIGVQEPGPAYVVSNGAGQASRGAIDNIFNHQILFGVRYQLFAADTNHFAPMLAPTYAPRPICVARDYIVFFDWDRADLTGRARQIIGEAAHATQAGRITRLDVNGYTDRSGSEAYNHHLSVRRALAVKAELMLDGVSPAEIAVHGYGDANPLVPTGKGVREPQNRRVEIIFH